MNRTHNTCKETRNGKGRHFESEGWHAIDLCRVFVIVDGQQAQACLGFEYPPSHTDTDTSQSQAGVIKSGCGFRSPLRYRHRHEVDTRPAIDGRIHNHRGQNKTHGQSDQRKRLSPNFSGIEDQPANGQGQQCSQHATAQRSRDHVPIGFGGKCGHAVHAHTKKCAMTKREIARIA